jgi:hypothetical protein
MPECPRCHQFVDIQAIDCPYCRTPLKAYGHPGITLHRAKDDTPLCASCTYHDDDTCTFPQRPYAWECTLYQDMTKPQEPALPYQPGLATTVKGWARRNAGWLALAVLLLVSLAVALSNQS